MDKEKLDFLKNTMFRHIERNVEPDLFVSVDEMEYFEEVYKEFMDEYFDGRYYDYK